MIARFSSWLYNTCDWGIYNPLHVILNPPVIQFKHFWIPWDFNPVLLIEIIHKSSYIPFNMANINVDQYSHISSANQFSRRGDAIYYVINSVNVILWDLIDTILFYIVVLWELLFNALMAYDNSRSKPRVNSYPAPGHCLCNWAARSKYDSADIQSAIFLYTSPILCSVLAELTWSTPNSRSQILSARSYHEIPSA